MTVRLEPWSDGDAAVLAELFDDPLVYRFTPIQPPFDIDAARRRIAIATRGEEGRSIRCRAVVNDAHLIVGEVAAYSRESDPRGEHVASLSYVIGASYRGYGYAGAATLAFIEEIQRAWSTQTFIAEIAPENPASQRVAEALGFTRDTSAEPVRRAGKDYSVIPWVLDARGPVHA